MSKKPKNIVKAKQKDVAELAGVAVSTVSKVFSEAAGISDTVRRKVIDAAITLGYDIPKDKIHQLVGGGKPTCIKLVIYYKFAMFDNENYFTEAIRGVREEANANGVEVSIELLRDGYESRFDELADKLVKIPGSAIVLMGIDHPKLLDALRLRNASYVVVSGYDLLGGCDSVSPNNRAGAHLATNKLLELGHKDIVCLTHKLSRTMLRRLDGFQDALTDNGIMFDPQKHLIEVSTANLDTNHIEKFVRSYIKKNGVNFTAVFCVSDAAALGLIHVLESLDYKIPEDVSIIGFDNLEVGTMMSPTLSSMGFNRNELGRIGVNRLMRRFTNPKSSILNIEMGVSLFERESIRSVN